MRQSLHVLTIYTRLIFSSIMFESICSSCLKTALTYNQALKIVSMAVLAPEFVMFTWSEVNNDENC